MGDATGRSILIFDFLPAKSVKINLNKIEGVDLKKKTKFLSVRQSYTQKRAVSGTIPGTDLSYYIIIDSQDINS